MRNIRILQTMQQNKLFYKILLYFLALLVPIVIIGGITYVKVERLIRSDVSEKLTENLKASSQTIDQYLNMARLTDNNLFFSDVVQRSLLPYDLQTEQEKVNMPALVRTIASTRNTMDPIIESIFLYDDDKKVYTGDGIYDFDNFFTNFHRFAKYPTTFWQQNLKRDRFFQFAEPDQVTNTSNNVSDEVIPSMSTQYINGYLTTIVVSISIPAIEQVLRNNSIFDSTAYTIIDAQRNVVLSSGGLSEAEIERLRDAGPSDTGQRTQLLSVGGIRSLAAHTSYNSFGWDYYSITPLSAFNQEPASILKLLLSICLSLIAIGVVFSLIFSMSLYNPIRNIREIVMGNMQQQEAGGKSQRHGELHMIGRRVRQLFEHSQDVTRRMDRFSNELLEKFFSDMLNGRQWGHKDTVEEILEKIDFRQGSYLCCCLLFHFNERFYYDIAEADRLHILEKLKNVLWGILRPKVNKYLLELEQHLYVFVVNLQDAEDRANFDLALEKVRLTFEYDTIYCDLLIGVGNVYGHISEIDKSLNDALTAIDKRATEPTAAIHDAAHMRIKQSCYYSFLDEINVIHGLKSGDIDLLRKDVEGIIQFNRKRGVSYQFLGNLLVMLFNSGYRYMIERNLNIGQLLADGEYAHLTDTSLLPGDYKDRMALLFRFYEKIIAETVGKLERKSTMVVGMISSYIEKNYGKDLYLELIAVEMGMSAKYISSLFKETTGMNITEYISLVRMTKAKELLTQSELSIGEISNRVGIVSRTTFLRNFKKHEGVSPMDYRKANPRRLGGA